MSDLAQQEEQLLGLLAEHSSLGNGKAQQPGQAGAVPGMPHWRMI
jgi:hypothetical protein